LVAVWVVVVVLVLVVAVLVCHLVLVTAPGDPTLRAECYNCTHTPSANDIQRVGGRCLWAAATPWCSCMHEMV
jgi:hypothetical protein